MNITDPSPVQINAISLCVDDNERKDEEPMEKNAQDMVRIIYDALDEKLGEEIEILNIDEISVIADYLVIANGRNQNQLNAMIDLVEEKMEEAGYDSKRIEGNKNSTWVLMDFGDVIVHVFSKEDRLFYDLERIWKDGKRITREEL